MLKKVSILTTAAMSLTVASSAQQVRPASSDKIYHEIAQMRHLVNVLYVAAHPDDENTRLLAWLVNDKNIRTAYLSLTRGDGGQNILGSEQGDALGLIRTHELMEARKLDGAEQFFSRAIDFGFSKSYQETFKHWDEKTLTGDAVWVMRKFRPDVVICRFPPDTLAGHGQHAASAIIAEDAFKAAGDGSQYADQLMYYKPWQPKRIFWNTYKFGDRNTTSESQLKVTVGDYSSTLGMSTGELAGASRSVHKSQGAGTPSVPGVQTEYFKLVDGEPVTESLFDGIDITWGRVGRKDIGDDLKVILKNFNFRHPDASLPSLLALRKKMCTVKDEYWRMEKLAELDKVILDCTGFMAELYAKQPQAVAGSSLPFTMQVIARSATPVVLQSITWTGNETATVEKNINNDSLIKYEHNILVPVSTPNTEPYWLAETAKNPGAFSIPSNDVLGLPETPNSLNSTLTLMIGDEVFKVKVPLSYKKLDPVKGDIVEQLRIVPKVELSFVNNLIITNADGSIDAVVKIHAEKEFKNGNLNISNSTSSLMSFKNVNLAANTDTIINIHIKPGSFPASADKEFYIYAMAGEGDGSNAYSKSQHVIQYSHIPTLQYFTTPFAKVLRRDWKVTAKRIGYIEGAGDLVPSVLREAGMQVDILKDADLKDATNLKKYDAIVTGIRAVNVEKKISGWLPVLFKYVENGGTLVMQYNTLQDMATTKIGPYPMTLSTLRVTEEDAKMTFTDPKAKLLNYPNTITNTDFDGWVQERGLYFPVKWDEKYSTLFSSHDSNENALSGGTLYTKYGKGNYIYTPLSFSRQLPAGNKGAIRLFMNMLSAGK